MALRLGRTDIVRVQLGVGILLACALAVGAGGLAVAEAPQHEHPDEVAGDGDPAALQEWFGDRMDRIHVDCSEGMAVGDFDACEDLDGEYDSYLERYVSVERETTANESARSGDDYAAAREQQAELASLLRQFDETHAAYETARRQGDERRARQLVRELRRLADRIDELGGDLEVRFRELDDAEGDDLERAANRTEATTEEVLTVTVAAERETLEPTALDVESDATASFGSPATVQGAVRTANGTAVSNGAVLVLDDAGHRTRVETAEDGTFRTTYRPVLTGPGETNVTVAYAPADADPYLGASETVTVDVSSTPVTVDLESATDRAAFGEAVAVAGSLSAAGDGPADVPVRLRVDGTTLGTARTDDAGQFSVEGRLPASVPPGNVTLEVRGSSPGTALAPASTSTPLSVTETGTTLTASVEGTDEEPRIAGRLATVEGEPVADQPVTLSVGDGERTVRTDADGRYALAVERPAERRAATVTYDGSGTNLAGSSAQTTLEPVSGADEQGVFETLRQWLGGASGGSALGALVGGDAGVGIGDLRAFVAANTLLAALLGVVALEVLAIAGLYVRGRRRGESTDADGTGFVWGSPAGTDGDEAAADGLAAARERLDGAPATAVQLAYASVRSALGTDDARTHWEVYREASADLDAERQVALRAVTETFEAATFAPEGVDAARARDALADAERCLSATDGGIDSGGDERGPRGTASSE